MSKFCPSCGSVVAADAASCPVCGETLGPGESAGDVTVTESTAAAGSIAEAEKVSAPAPAAGEAKQSICPSCGAANLPDARFCSACGSSLTEPGTKGTKGAPERSAPTRSRGAIARDYLFTSIGAIIIAGIVFLIATPEEHTGPPQPAAAAGEATGGANGMPPGHPSTNQPPALTPEQEAQVAELAKKVKENPADMTATLKLANIYYDLERHTEAIPLYREYLKKYPDSADARTDMAFSIASAGDLKTAIDELNMVMRKNPKHQNAAYNLATMYLASRNRDSTLFWLERVVEIDSTTQAGQAAAQILREVAGAHDHPHDSAAPRQ